MGARLLHDCAARAARRHGRDRGAARRRRRAAAATTRCASELRDLLEACVRPAAADGPRQHRPGHRRGTWPPSPRTLRTAARGSRRSSPAGGRRCCSDLEGRLELCPDLRELLDAALADDPPLRREGGGVIRDGLRRRTRRAARDRHARARTGSPASRPQEITRTGIAEPEGRLQPGLRLLHRDHATPTRPKVPADYSRKQTLKNAERYITPELKEYEEKVLTRRGQEPGSCEYELFLPLRDQVAAADAAAAADRRGAGGARRARGAGRAGRGAQLRAGPMLVDEPVLDIRDGRHPVLDQTLPPGTFVPNDATLGPDDGHVLAHHRAEHGGQEHVHPPGRRSSRCWRTIGQLRPGAGGDGSASTDRIFTRVGASDELSRGQSTFMVEMTEAANILNNATRAEPGHPRRDRPRHEHLRRRLAGLGDHRVPARRGRLPDAVRHALPRAGRARRDAAAAAELQRRWCASSDDEIVFLHKIAPGSADKSYGIHVARLAGVPKPVLDRATGHAGRAGGPAPVAGGPATAGRRPAGASSDEESPKAGGRADPVRGAAVSTG